MGKIVGIDLGTSTSEVAIFELGKPRVLLNDRESTVTPSAVWAGPSGELVVGESAYKQPGAVREFKRRMGREERLQLGSHALLPEECSALLLRYLLKCAQARLGEEIDRAVITVPANWKDAPRRATQEAGRLAGVRVERLINEPTAAAMAFGIRPEAEGKTIAVYDLGGGTFDVTVLKIHSKVFDVVTSTGDAHLGGSDIDDIMVRHVLEQTAAATGYTHALGQNEQIDRDLKLACERAKKELSFAREVQLNLPFLGLQGTQPVGVDMAFSRQALERLIEPLVQRSLDYMGEALRQAGLARQAIDEVVLVGGSTRIPYVRQRVAEWMGKEPNSRDVHPEEAVALGASIQAGIIDQEEVTDDSPLILDVTNNALGVEIMTVINGQPVAGVFSPIIEKNVKIPVTKTGEYMTARDNQQSIEVKCYQGNSKWVAQNTLIGVPILVDDLPLRPAGEVKIEITFSLGVSEMLDVGVQIHDAGIALVRSFDIGGGKNSDEQRKQRQETIDTLWQRSEAASRYKPLIERAEEKLRDHLPPDTAASLRAALDRLKRAVAGNHAEAAEQADLDVANILFDLD